MSQQVQVNIARVQREDPSAWDGFVRFHAHGCAYHLSAWQEAITGSYSHDACCLVATRSAANTDRIIAGDVSARTVPAAGDRMTGLLPLVQIRHWLFGNSLISMPFCDAGGVLAVDAGAERTLVEHALRAAEERRASTVELRQYQPLACVGGRDPLGDVPPSGVSEALSVPGWRVSMAGGNKVRMLLDLPGDPDALMRMFDAKLRNLIRKPQKLGLEVTAGGIDLIDDFYDVLAVNMRDLGSPVHSKSFLRRVLANYSGSARIFIVYGQGVPMACGLTLGFNDILSNPWASSLRRFNQQAPNMLLYWAMIEHACRNNYRAFDFGRSTAGGGTYRFKEQWGARPVPLYWYRFARADRVETGSGPDPDRVTWAKAVWKRLPVPVTRAIGPMLRRYISL